MAGVQIDPSHIVTSPWKDVPYVPDTDIYTFMFNREAVGNYPPARDPNRIAFIDAPSGTKITYRELKERIENLSRGMSSRMGIKAGDTICFYLPNHIDYPTALWAALRMGVIPSCANPIYTPTELVHQLKLSKSKFLLTHPMFIKAALEAASQAGIAPANIFLISKADNLFHVNVPDLVEIGKTAPEIIPLKLAPTEAKTKIAFLNFSSGTSGLPKGVMITHYNVIANICQMYACEREAKSKVCNGCLPFFHIYGLVVLMHLQLNNGVTVVIQPSFSPEAFVEDIHKYKITSLFVVPPILLALLHRVQHGKLKFNPRLESICCAAAPLPRDLVPPLRKIWPNTTLRQGWGMTETAVAITLTPVPSPHGMNHTCGPLLANCEAVIVDMDNLKSVAPGKGQGELWVRSPSITLGYISNPKETNEMFNIAGQGWMRTGDEAEFEKGKVSIEGKIRDEWLLCIRDRLKELIKVSGNQVAPAELENVLASHPCIADQCVVGKPDNRKGEVPWAIVVKKKEVTKEEIMEWVRKRTSKHKHLGGVEFVDQIVKNPSGKILKRVYREQFKKQAAATVKAKL